MRGFSLSELVITLVIGLAWATLAMPLFTENRKNAQFTAFASEITASFTAAKQYAQLSGHSVTVDFDAASDLLFKMTSHGRLIASRQRSTAPKHQPTMTLPSRVLSHPTTGRRMTIPLSSTHGTRIIFGQRGSSSATLVFSQGDARVLCIVIAGQTGRMRAFVHRDGAWIDFQ